MILGKPRLLYEALYLMLGKPYVSMSSSCEGICWTTPCQTVLCAGGYHESSNLLPVRGIYTVYTLRIYPPQQKKVTQKEMVLALFQPDKIDR